MRKPKLDLPKTPAKKLESLASLLRLGVVFVSDDVDWPLRIMAHALDFAAEQVAENDGLTDQDLQELTAERITMIEEVPIPEDVMPTTERAKAVRGAVAITRAVAPRRKT